MVQFYYVKLSNFALFSVAPLVPTHVAHGQTGHAGVGGLDSSSTLLPASFPGYSRGAVVAAQWLTQSEPHSPDGELKLVD